ncbi:hypothetical protein [Nocardia transvalensis]|uniref:hypothetical protein n=1 Tax=Nocardia transvalensis TaxID=37333 RepID=UPI001894F816|nr:hypothetical protein [Nocardia transvalensis]MBF6330950.1 hypothetical protein [Nocardia transvalensis]
MRRIWRTWLTERRDDWRKLIAQFRAGGVLDFRVLFMGAANASARMGVSSRLTQVIRATRLILLLTTAGLVLVGFTVWRNYDPKSWLSYVAALMFVAAWAVARWGIWAEVSTDSEFRWRGGWLRNATIQTAKWFAAFMLISVLAGDLITRIEKLLRGPGQLDIGGLL